MNRRDFLRTPAQAAAAFLLCKYGSPSEACTVSASAYPSVGWVVVMDYMDEDGNAHVAEFSVPERFYFGHTVPLFCSDGSLTITSAFVKVNEPR